VERVEEVTYLDTHVAIWIYDGNVDKLSRTVVEHIHGEDLRVSPAVILELEFLHEIRRLKKTASDIVTTLADDIGLQVCELPFAAVVEQALHQKWVRDPFDRLIVGHASANEAPLVTKDEKIRKHYRRAVW
jgi:PIN domain nuclease of toxin-antitoxin system